jgi:hypothetical protein
MGSARRTLSLEVETIFFDRTEKSIQTLRRVRTECDLEFVIRLKTIVMDQNLHDLSRIAHYAQMNDLEVFYQPIEQNYNTLEDSTWFE